MNASTTGCGARCRFGFALLALHLLATTSLGGVQDDDDQPPAAQGKTCQIHLQIDPHGTATIAVTLMGLKAPPSGLSKQLQSTLGEAIAAPFKSVRHNAASGVVYWQARAEQAFP